MSFHIAVEVEPLSVFFAEEGAFFVFVGVILNGVFGGEEDFAAVGAGAAAAGVFDGQALPGEGVAWAFEVAFFDAAAHAGVQAADEELGFAENVGGVARPHQGLRIGGRGFAVNDGTAALLQG